SNYLTLIQIMAETANLKDDPQARDSILNGDKLTRKRRRLIICLFGCTLTAIIGSILDTPRLSRAGLVINWFPTLIGEMIGLPDFISHWVLPYLYWLALG